MFGQVFDPHMQQRRTRRTHHRRTEEKPQDKNMALLVQFFPILLILLFFGLFSNTPENPYSMHLTDNHKFEQKSNNLSVPFYVSNKYFNMSPREKHTIQYHVEREHLQTLQTLCDTELVN